ncbi:MAG: hypothetical protein AB7O88_07805 [Reyranellaceae bacterium]
MRGVALILCLALAAGHAMAADPAPRQRIQVYRQPGGATIIIRREKQIVLRNADGTRTVLPATPTTPALPPRWQR